jgi:aminoglycoside phosphotransferase family enzyme
MPDGTADTDMAAVIGQDIPPDRKVAFLCRADSYPEHPARVEIVETHFSWVFLTDTRAYKLKKPVRGEGFDFRSIAARRRNAVTETRLNRRLAPDVYLGVVPMTLGRDGELALGGTGPVVDWLIKMVRLDAGRTLEQYLKRRDLNRIAIAVLARRLAAFYAGARRVRLAPALFATRVKRELAACHRAFRSAGKPHLLHAMNLSRRCLISFLNRHGALFHERLRRGRFVDGHGDLRPEHIYLNGTPRIIDCLEFRGDLRIVDPVGEIAYLAVECRRLGDRRVERELLRCYRQRTGDAPPPELFRFYATLNALIRARIAVQHLSEPGARPPAEWLGRAAEYLNIAATECACWHLRVWQNPAGSRPSVRAHSFTSRGRKGWE